MSRPQTRRDQHEDHQASARAKGIEAFLLGMKPQPAKWAVATMAFLVEREKEKCPGGRSQFSHWEGGESRGETELMLLYT